MKTIAYYLCIIICLSFSSSLAAEKQVTIFSTGDYLPASVIQRFYKETGIRVNYAEFESNQAMYAKLRSNPNIGYDIVVPSSYYIQRMVKAHLLAKLDKKRLPNIKYLNPLLLNLPFDRHNQYSLPYLWGTTGIVINTQYIKPSQIKSWQDFWQPKWRNQIMLINDDRDVFSTALISLGYSINTVNHQQIKKAYKKLVKLLPNVKLYASNNMQSVLADGDANIGMTWNGSYLEAKKDNPHLQYILPKEGFSYWIDCLVLLKNAPHKANAYRFLNFLMRPDIAKQIAGTLLYSTPHLAAIPLLPKQLRDDPAFNPPTALMKNAQLQKSIESALVTYENYWELLKIQGD